MERQRLGASMWFTRVWWWRRSGLSARAFCLAQGFRIRRSWPGERDWFASWRVVCCRFILTCHDPVAAVLGVCGAGGLSPRDRWFGAQGAGEPGTAAGECE